MRKCNIDEEIYWIVIKIKSNSELTSAVYYALVMRNIHLINKKYIFSSEITLHNIEYQQKLVDQCKKGYTKDSK
jgi:hypothetical protein